MSTATEAPLAGGERLQEAEAERVAVEAVAPGMARPSRYRPERLTARTRAGEIPRAGEWRITEGRLFVECRKGAAIFCRRRSPSERESIAAEAYLRIVERYGGKLPPRGAILDGAVLNPAGIKLIRRAIDSAVKAPRTWRETAEHEHETTPLEEAERAGSLVEAEEAESGYLPGAPSAVAEDMRGALVAEGLTRKEATAVLVRAAEMSTAEAAEAFNIAAGSVSAIVSQGASALRERYPDGADLVGLLQGARARLAEEAEREAREALSWLSYSARNPREAEEDNPGGVRPEADYRHALTAARRYVGHVLEERGGFLPRGAKDARRAVEVRQGRHVPRLTATEASWVRRARYGGRPGAPLATAHLPRRHELAHELAPEGSAARYSWRRLSEQRARSLADHVGALQEHEHERPAPTAGRLPAPRRALPTAPRARVWTETAETAPERRYLHAWGGKWGDGAAPAVTHEWRARSGGKLKRRKLQPRTRLALRREAARRARLLAPIIEAAERRNAEHVQRLAVAERERRAARGRRMRLLANARRKHAPGADRARLARLVAEAAELTPEERTALGVAATWEAEEDASTG
jgi:hypothetical protein